MGQKGLCHLMMPASVAADFVVIHPQFALGLFDHSFDRPALGAPPPQIMDGGIVWCMGQKHLEFVVVRESATQHQRRGSARTALTLTARHLYRCDVGDD